jgi:starch synthase
MPITHRRKLPLKVLFATPEIRPLIKTGGLGDVSASLPAALMKARIDVRVLVPGYPSVLAGAQHECLLARTHLPGAGEITLLSAHAPDSGVPLIIVDCPAYYDRKGGPYQDLSGLDWPDNAQRFALFSKIGALIGSSANPLDWQPHVVHCNDWQTGLTPAYLHYTAGPKSPTVMTIHNIAYQGIFPPTYLAATGLPPESFSMHGVEYHGSLSFLKAGLFYADRITTVSPTYAREIQGKLLGFGMQGLLAERSTVLSGILNGIDEEEWNPWHDPYLVEPFHGGRLKGKAANKRALQERLGLAVEPDVPLLGVVSRITQRSTISSPHPHKSSCSARVKPRWKHHSARSPHVTLEQSASLSASTKHSRTRSKRLRTFFLCRRASNPVASTRCIASATAPCRWCMQRVGW